MHREWGLVLGVLVLVGLLFVLRESPEPSATETTVPATSVAVTTEARSEMAVTAQAFLDALDAEQQERVRFPFASDERFDWHYVPRSRPGLPLADLTAEQREAAMALLRQALSDDGLAKTLGVLELEGILGELTGNRDFRDPERYYVSVFGNPDPDEPWGWRFEGHHLSLNFSAVTDSLTATTPLFLGANPATVPSGPRAGWRVLADEEDQARALLHALTEAQRARAIIATSAPRDIITGAERTVPLDAFEGLPASAMTEAQQAALWQLIETYVGHARDEWAVDRLDALRATSPDSLFFAWAGGTNPGEGHYYRVHAPRLLIEYDNTQGGANHIHAVSRDPANDFGTDWLRLHYEAHPHD